MSFILSLFSDSAKNKASNVELEALNKLKQQLVDVGFAPDEVNYMVRKHTKKSYTELSSMEIKEIKTALSAQLEIAQKCLNLTKEQ